jgi:hypothetical protein
LNTDIIKQIDGCDGLMWHWNQMDYRAMLVAKQITLAISQMGIKSFPDINTSWHFDDKLGQKYLLEALKAPLVPSYVFYSKNESLNWAKNTTFPKVFKLRGGAGSVNVKLVKTNNQANRLIRKSFSKGFKNFNRWAYYKDKIRLFLRNRNMSHFLSIIAQTARLLIPSDLEKMSGNEKGYIYFQDFIPGNEYDTRLIVIGNRCFGLRRYNRKNDFRASGSGIIAYEPTLFEPKCVKIAFDIAKKLNTQSIALDFIWDKDIPKIVEISYCFVMGKVYDDCPGYWDDNLNWHNAKVNPQYFIIEDFINSLYNQ